jgi:Nuclease-related domain
MISSHDDPDREPGIPGASRRPEHARSLAKHLDAGVVLLRDGGIPHGPANIDRIAVAPSGVWVIDSKHYSGKVAVCRPLFGQANLTIAGRDQTKLIDGRIPVHGSDP